MGSTTKAFKLHGTRATADMTAKARPWAVLRPLSEATQPLGTLHLSADDVLVGRTVKGEHNLKLDFLQGAPFAKAPRSAHAQSGVW